MALLEGLRIATERRMRLLGFLLTVNYVFSATASTQSCESLLTSQTSIARPKKWNPPPLKGFLTRQMAPRFLEGEPSLSMPISSGMLGITRFNSAPKHKKIQLIPFHRGTTANTTLVVSEVIVGNLKIETFEVGQRLIQEKRRDGEAVLKSKIKEILDFIFPLYLARRGWDSEMIQGLEEKAYATAESTKYTTVRDVETNVILGVIGATRAPFGKVTFKDLATGKWVEVFGQFGQSFDLGVAIPDFPSIPYLNSPIPILPTEEYLPELDLYRPSIVEQKYDDYYTELGRLNRVSDLESDLWNMNLRPTPGSPFYVSSGVLIEPTKFGIAKDIESHGVTRAILIKELFAGVFDLNYINDFSRNGTYLYTYNDEQGVPLYRRMGFKTLSNKPILKNGSNWIPLGMSPVDYLKSIQSNKFGTNDISEQFSIELEEHLMKVTRDRLR